MIDGIDEYLQKTCPIDGVLLPFGCPVISFLEIILVVLFLVSLKLTFSLLCSHVQMNN
jgi:hypothetical protein